MKNFKKYIEEEFDFGEEGLCLISGQSGSGKTTILQGLFYCLYGSVTKGFLPHSKPKSKCEVTLTSKDFIIKRRNSPKIVQYTDLTTDETYENETAQAIINEKFGELFSISSYIQQNAINSFVTMSPAEKMTFLEKFAFQNINFDVVRKKVSDAIEKEREKLSALTGQLQYVSEHFLTLTKPEKKSFPALDLENKTKEEAASEHYETLEKYKTQIEKTIREIEKINRNISIQKIHNEKILGKKMLLDEQKDALRKQQKIRSSISYDGDENLLQLEENLAEILKEKEKRTREQRYYEGMKNLETMRRTERENKEEERKNLKETLWLEYSEEELEESIRSFSLQLLLIEDANKLSLLMSKNFVEEEEIEKKQHILENLEKDAAFLTKKIHTLEIQKDLLICPSCDSLLKLENKELKLIEDNIDKDAADDIEKINELVAKLNLLNVKISKIKKEIYSEREKLKNYKEAQEKKKDLDAKIEYDEKTVREYIEYFTYTLKESRATVEKLKRLDSDLTMNRFSKAVNQLEKELENRQSPQNLGADFMKISPQKPVDLLSEEMVRDEIQNQRIFKLQKKENDAHISSLQKSIEKIEEDIRTENKKLEDETSLSLLEEKLVLLMEKKEKLEKNISKRINISEKLEKFFRYKEESKNYKEWLEKKEKLEIEEKKQKAELTAITTFKEKIKEAESIAIENIISSINAYVQEYLDLFFPHDPISVTLKAFKETKKKESKAELNFDILYKETQGSTISSLSGGEYARVVLAFLLSMAEMFNSPIIMLDEPTASLDLESTSNVIEGIRKNFSKKLVIIIAHQVISGEFDREINL